jgi:hypothetical protein
MNIQNFCNYLEQIGMIDQNSINNFLSIFSLISQKKKLNNNNKISTSSIYVNALSTYLKHILSIDDNFKIFAHKIIKKYSQNLLIKQYSSINTMFIIFTNRLNIEKFSCFLHLKKFSDMKIIRNKRIFDIKKSLSLQNLYPNKEEEYYLQTKSSEINTSNYLNYSTFMNNKKNNKITAKTMFLKKQNQLMNKIRKEHNIKFKKPRINNLSCEPRKKYIFFDENGYSNKNNLNNLHGSRNSSNNININCNASDYFNGSSFRKINNKQYFDFSNYFSNNN